MPNTMQEVIPMVMDDIMVAMAMMRAGRMIKEESYGGLQPEVPEEALVGAIPPGQVSPGPPAVDMELQRMLAERQGQMV